MPVSDLWAAVDSARALPTDPPGIGALRQRNQRRRLKRLAVILPVITVVAAVVSAGREDERSAVIADGRLPIGHGAEVPFEPVTRPLSLGPLPDEERAMVVPGSVRAVGQIAQTALVEFQRTDGTTCFALLGASGEGTACREKERGRPATSASGEGPLLWSNVPADAKLVQLTTEDTQQWQRPRRGYALLPGSGTEAWWLPGFRVEALDVDGDVIASEEWDANGITYSYRVRGEMRTEFLPHDPTIDETQISAERPYAQGSEDDPRGDHWHVAYGVYACDEYLPFLEDPGRDPHGIHTHGDGVIHVHPFTPGVGGPNARLSLFERLVGVIFDDDRLKYDGHVFETGDECNGAPGQVRFLVNGSDRVGDPSNYRFRDCDVVVVAFTRRGATIPPLPWASTLNNLSDVPSDSATCPLAKE